MDPKTIYVSICSPLFDYSIGTIMFVLGNPEDLRHKQKNANRRNIVTVINSPENLIPGWH